MQAQTGCIIAVLLDAKNASLVAGTMLTTS